MAAPANDNLANAEVLTGTSGTAEGTTFDATPDPSAYDAVTDPADGGGGSGSVWYKLAVPGDWSDTDSTLAIRLVQHLVGTGEAQVVEVVGFTTTPPVTSADVEFLTSGYPSSGNNLIRYSGPAPSGGFFYIGIGAQEIGGEDTFTLIWAFSDVAPRGISVGFDDDTLEPAPFWTRLDDRAAFPGLSVQRWTIDRGRNSEEDKTATGTATVEIKDTDGTLDPTNTTGPFYGLLDPTKQAAIALQNPVTLDWTTLFRGFVAEWLYEMDVSQKFATVTLELVDAFDILTALEMTPGNQGDTVPAGSEGDIYFTGEPFAYKHVNQRIIQALADAGWPTELQRVFSGNVTVQDQIYARRDQLLNVGQEAADAEFPGVANIYVSKAGIVTFHGRYARFNPERPGYGIGTWKAGDVAACLADPDTAPISGLSYRRSKSDIINAALALPKGVDDSDVPGALVKDDTSIATHGWRSVTFEGLLTYAGHDDAGDPTTAVDETKKFATYYVDNYKNPRTRVSQIRFRPQDPDSGRNPAALWALICGVETGDLIPLKTTHPGGGGFDEDFYAEHVHYEAVPMREDFPEVTLDIDVSPRSYFDSNPFPPVPDNDDMAGAFALPTTSGSTAGNSDGFSNEGGDPVAASSKDPIVQTFTSLFTGMGGSYGDEAADTHNFRTAWWKWTAPAAWGSGSSFTAALTGQTAVSCLLLVKCGVSGVPPDNGDFTALGTGGAVNTAGDKSPLTQAEAGDAIISAGDVVYIGVGSMDLSGEDFSLAWTYSP